MNKKIIWGVIVIVVLAVVGWVVFNPNYTKYVEDTYSHPEMGYSVKYPHGWKIEPSKDGSVRIVNPTHRGVPDSDEPFEAVIISFTQNPCVSADWTIGFGHINHKTACVSRNNETVTVYMSAFDEQAKNIEDSILSSLVFSPAVASVPLVQTATAKTYSNPEYGFTLKYSPEFTIDQNFRTNVENVVGFSSIEIEKYENRPRYFIGVSYAKSDLGDPAVVLPALVKNAQTGKQVPFSKFKEVKIGSNTFYYLVNELFEGDLSISYYLVQPTSVLGFHSVSHGASSNGVSWSTPGFEIDKEIGNVKLREMLATLSLTANPSKKPLTVLSPKGAEIVKLGSTLDIKWTGGENPLEVMLETYSEGELVVAGWIATKVSPFAGHYTWKVGDIFNTNSDSGAKTYSKVLPGKYFVRVNDFKTGTLDRSDTLFTITN
jgi:hypothetical protein